MRGRQRRTALAIAGATLGTLVLAATGVGAPGDLKQVDRDLSRSDDVALAPNGKQVYSVNYPGATLATLQRNATTGALSGATAVSADGLLGANALAVPRDGENVYVVGEASDSVHVFTRDGDGSVSEEQNIFDGDNAITELEGASDVAVSPDGNTVYVTGEDDDGVMALSRDRSNDGRLAFVDAEIDGGGGIDAGDLIEPRGIAVSPDGDNVYVVSEQSGTIITFERFGTGVISEIQTRDGDADSAGPTDVTVSPDGRHVYVTATVEGAVLRYTRDPQDGTLSYGGSLTDPQVGGPQFFVQPVGITVSPDGGNAYVAGTVPDDAINVFSRKASGQLAFRSALNDSAANEGLANAKNAAVSPDGRHVYVAGANTGNGGIVSLSRQPQLTLGGKKAQSGKKLVVTADCSADCNVTLTAKGYKPAKAQLKAIAKPKKLVLKPKGKAPTAGKRVVAGKAKAGNRTASAKRSIKIK